MAGNSVPVFFGAKARTKKPPGIDVTSITDLSGSMGPFASFISSQSTIVALENELVAQGIGVLSPNRYSFTTGGDRERDTLPAIELPVTVNGVVTRWAPGANVLNGTAQIPQLSANSGGNTENMARAANLVAGIDRGYLSANTRIIIAGSDEQDEADAFVASPLFPYRYVGVHSVTFSISEPAGPNPVPAGTLVGFVYTTNTIGTAIYISGNTINYRNQVPVANVLATGTLSPRGGTTTLQVNVDRAAETNGAIYNIEFFNAGGFDLLATSLGNVLGKFLFETS